MTKKVTVDDLVKSFQLEVVTGWERLDREVTVVDLYRPGLELAGFFSHHSAERLQLFGESELSFIQGLTEEERKERLGKLCTPTVPCFILTRNLSAPVELVKVAEEWGIPILRTPMSSTKFGSTLTNYLEKYLAPTTTVHGVLVDVYGSGVLIMGDSGIGKSETALELVKRGHRLVADDAVEIQQTGDGLIGSSPDLIRHLLEIRGLGIINIMTLFGAGAVLSNKKISFAIYLEAWQVERQYDRLGLDEEMIHILDTDLPQLTVPVRPGRNLAVIIEVAAMNFRLKRLGYNAAQEFVSKLSGAMSEGDEWE